MNELRLHLIAIKKAALVSKETVVELLIREHDRESFDCGVDELNNYLKHTALQHHKRNLARTHVLARKDGSGAVVAFATLNIGQISTEGNEDHPGFKKLPRSVPVLRLCRLAVHHEHKRKGAGEYMMGFTFAKAIEISEGAGCAGILVDAKDEKDKAYYQKYGFVALTTAPLTLFMAMGTVEKLTSGKVGSEQE